MLNCFTNGTKYDASYYKPFNEDYIVIGQIKAFDGHQIVFSKVWDTTEKLYYAKPLINANNTEVTTLEDYFDIGEYSVFYRVGDFNSKGSVSFERHIEDVNNTSWVVFTAKKLTSSTIGDDTYLIDTFGYHNRIDNGWTVYNTSIGKVYGCNCSPLFYEFNPDSARQVWQLPKDGWKEEGKNIMASCNRSLNRMKSNAILFSNNKEPLSPLTNKMPVYVFNYFTTISEDDATFTPTTINAWGLVIPLPSCYSSNNSLYTYDGQDPYTSPNNQYSGLKEDYDEHYLQIEDVGYTEAEFRVNRVIDESTFLVFNGNFGSGRKGEQIINPGVNDTLEILNMYTTNQWTKHKVINASHNDDVNTEWTIKIDPVLPQYPDFNHFKIFLRDRKSLLGDNNHPAYGRLRYEHYKLSINNTHQIAWSTDTPPRLRLLGCNFNWASNEATMTIIGNQMATKKQEVPNYPGLYAGAVRMAYSAGIFKNKYVYTNIANSVPYVEFSMEAKNWSVVDQITGLWRQAVPGDIITGLTLADKWFTYRCGIEDYTNYNYNLAIRENYKDEIWNKGIPIILT